MITVNNQALFQANREQYQTAKNLDVRQAFNSLPKERQVDIWTTISNYYQSSGFHALAGDTLEVGCGNALFWTFSGQELLNKITEKGRLILTDISPGMIEECLKIELLKGKNITIEEADVAGMKYADNTFARIIANFVLYECKTEDKVIKGIREIARVLKDDGRAALVTMDENHHMIELYNVLQKAKNQLEAEGVTMKAEFPKQAPAIQPFCVGNGERLLKTVFGKVACQVSDNAILVDKTIASSEISGPDFVVKYLQSLAFVQAAMKTGELTDRFFGKIRDIVDEEIRLKGVFRISRRDVIYDCSEPIKQL